MGDRLSTTQNHGVQSSVDLLPCQSVCRFYHQTTMSTQPILHVCVAVLCLMSTDISTVAARDCAITWTKDNLRCYKALDLYDGYYYKKLPNQTVAYKECYRQSAYLVTPITKHLNDFMLNMMSDPPMWIGITDAAKEGTWLLHSGDPVTWTNWRTGYPSSDTSKNCAVMMWPDGQWIDTECGDAASHICGKPFQNAVVG